MRFASLGSGSRGNATLVESGRTCIMLDCGFSATETQRRLASRERHIDSIDAILVTHEHGDHIRGVAALAKKYAIPVWLTVGTAQAHQAIPDTALNLFNPHEFLEVGDIQIEPYPVPHDAREPCQFVFGDGAKRLGVLTDTGSLTEHIAKKLDGCNALLLECNHDTNMLANGSYPPVLKQRVGGRAGHLSNDQAAQLLKKITTSDLQHLVAAHLSEKNNTPELARTALAASMDCDAEWIGIADQVDGLEWREIT